MPCHVGPVARRREEEAQRSNRAVHGRRLHAGAALVLLIAAQIFRLGRIGRATEEDREGLDVADVVALGLLAPKRRSIMSSIMRARSGLMAFEVIGDVLRLACSDPSILRTLRPSCYRRRFGWLPAPLAQTSRRCAPAVAGSFFARWCPRSARPVPAARRRPSPRRRQQHGAVGRRSIGAHDGLLHDADGA